ncbi:MAG: chemotaxis protein CheW [Spirochaetes bacterium]|nr:chemotaxis protein CheW [Spirochaetota bacterium]
MSTDLWELKEQAAKVESINQIDFKMISFSLGGKGYGINIMKVKEILKVNKFTYVPNSEPYVRGVYNLRGDIISIIDLRVMFHVKKEEKKDDYEDVIVIAINENKIGVIVDSISKVIGIESSTIQPPHPIFSNISIKYISGVVDKDGKIYVILDVDRILGEDKADEEEAPAAVVSPAAMEIQPEVEKRELYKAPEKETDINKDFIKETLKTLINFNITDINNEWFVRHFDNWAIERRKKGENIQLTGVEDAHLFVEAFGSKNTGNFFDQTYADLLKKVLPSETRGNYYAWNVGCANGYETYSIAAILKQQNPDAAIKVWANDKDLLSISTAPNLPVDLNSVPQYLKPFVTEGTKGGAITQALKKIIYFEFHDVKNHNPYPDVDMIICRDVLPAFNYNEQINIISEFYEKLKNNGILILGDNERIKFDGFERYGEEGIIFYRKKGGVK